MVIELQNAIQAKTKYYEHTIGKLEETQLTLRREHAIMAEQKNTLIERNGAINLKNAELMREVKAQI